MPQGHQHISGPRDRGAEGFRPTGRQRDGWFVAREAGSYTLARQWPPRFDVSANAAFPALDPARLARQIRQDLWRLFRGLRGFSPVVRVDVAAQGLIVRAGGRVDAKRGAPGDTHQQIAALLGDPVHRARWARCARTGGQA